MDADAREPYSRPLSELRGGDSASFGGKSASLGELVAAGIPVPPGFALSVDAFGDFVEKAGLADMLAGPVARGVPGDVTATAAASRAIREVMRRAPVPDSVREEVASRYGELSGTHRIGSPPVAVRSSAVGEDSKDATFAGQQESYLWVRGVERVCGAIRDCWVSAYSPEAISYRARLPSADRQPSMGVTVQLMVDALVSGVAFTCNPVSGDPSMVAVNASWGLGLAVVGGEVTPDDYLVSKVTGEPVRQRVHVKAVQYLAGSDGAVRAEVPEALRDSPCLDERALAAVVDVARRAERHFGSHQDVEWAIARDAELSDGLFVVQSRPVTAVPKPKQRPAPASALSLVMKTFGAE